jgi:hypothetical protein
MDSLQNYLKKFSTIDEKFIDDFFSLYKYDTKEDEFVIDLNKEDKIFEIQSNIIINIGEKPFWMDKKEIQTKDSFQILNDNWKIKGK